MVLNGCLFSFMPTIKTHFQRDVAEGLLDKIADHIKGSYLD